MNEPLQLIANTPENIELINSCIREAYSFRIEKAMDALECYMDEATGIGHLTSSKLRDDIQNMPDLYDPISGQSEELQQSNVVIFGLLQEYEDHVTKLIKEGILYTNIRDTDSPV